MSSNKPGAYGTSTGGDTAFRKTWDRDEYAAKAVSRDQQIKDEGKARAEAAAEVRPEPGAQVRQGLLAGTPRPNSRPNTSRATSGGDRRLRPLTDRPHPRLHPGPRLPRRRDPAAAGGPAAVRLVPRR